MMQIKPLTRITLYTVSVMILVPLAIWKNYQPAAKINYESLFASLYISGDYILPDNSPDYVAMVQRYIDQPDINNIVAIGCTDAKQLMAIKIPAHKTYTCIDVVADLIHYNNAEYSADNLRFNYVDNIDAIAKQQIHGDLLIVKDFLRFWPIKDIKLFISVVVPRFKYALITHPYAANSLFINYDTGIATNRYLDLLQPPFNLRQAKIMLEYETNSISRRVLSIS